jgi:1,2-diacylglycerol 3-alpha-glucosyltransferase
VRPRVLLVCPGLEHAHRGFEAFARECFEALRDRPEIELELVKGSGTRRPQETVIPTLTRDTRAAQLLGRWISREPFVVEHVAFAFALIPLLVHRRPDVVYFSEWHVGRVLAKWRDASRQPLALVFANGAFASLHFHHLDRVQQFVPGAIEYSVRRGESASNQELLPLAVSIERDFEPPADGDRSALRRRLGLPADRRVVFSAAALARHHKRLDYLIEEIASMPDPRPFLLLAGDEEEETPGIRRLARERLGVDGHDIRTVPAAEMPDHYRASDALVLASLWEMFGRVLVEAQSHGLPCLAHEHPVMQWVLGEHGDTADLRQPGAVAAWLQGPIDASDDARHRRHRSAYERFSWDTLADRYVGMLRGAAKARRPAPAAHEARG